MNKDVIAAKVEIVRKTLERIRAHIIAEIESQPSQTMADGFSCLGKQKIITMEVSERMKKAVGFRNISVHDYQAIDWQIVYSICTKHLVDFEDFIQQIVTYCGI